MSKQKINRFVGSIGAFIGILVFVAYIPQLSLTYKEKKLNHSNHYSQQLLV